METIPVTIEISHLQLNMTYVANDEAIAFNASLL